jgi:hypothetical protein
MLNRFRPRVTYANVTSTLALFLALTTGTVYAANEWTGANIRNGTITSVDIKDGTLTTADIKNATVTGTDVHDGSISGTDVVDNSITSADVAPLNGDLDIADNTITTFDLADNSVDQDEVLDFGLTNEDVGVLFAQIADDGTVSSSSGGVTSQRLGLGQYNVDFGRNVSACAFVATQGEAGAGGAPGAVLGATDRSGVVTAAYVTARSDAGAFVDRAFTIVVVC